MCTVTHSEDLCDSFAATNNRTKSSINKIVARPLVFHPARIGSHVAAKAERSDRNGAVDCSLFGHILTPKIVGSIYFGK
ncbi:hypothetical protein D3C87_1668160 [compost metagenome]